MSRNGTPKQASVSGDTSLRGADASGLKNTVARRGVATKNKPIAESKEEASKQSVIVEETNGNIATMYCCESSVQGDGRVGAVTYAPIKKQPHHQSPTSPSNIALSLPVRLFTTAIKPLLPEGYPSSVSKDYAAYQMWDTLQCLCSSATGTLSTRAVLMGVGVGQAHATALSGTVAWLLRDVFSKLGSVWFAAYFATDLDNDAKRWRYVADLANDAGLFLEIFSVHLPPTYFMLCVCVASLFKAICGVAGGASKASLTQHFAVRHNMADVAARDGSQETIASLLGMLLGTVLACLIPETNFYGTLIGYVIFTALHLFTNYQAVTALVLTNFNRHRARHCIVEFLRDGSVLSCEVANKKESVLLCGESAEPFTVCFGARPSEVLERYKSSDDASVSAAASAAVSEGISYIAKAEKGHRFAVVANKKAKRYDVLLGRGGEEDALWAYYVICRQWYTNMNGRDAGGRDGDAPVLVLTPQPRDGFDLFCSRASAAGWDLSKLQFRIFEWRVGFV